MGSDIGLNSKRVAGALSDVGTAPVVHMRRGLREVAVQVDGLQAPKPSDRDGRNQLRPVMPPLLPQNARKGTHSETAAVEGREVKLSVLCPALLCRSASNAMLGQLREQIEGRPVELIVLTDNGVMSVGEKCNHLYRMARGEYASMVADDDHIEPDYVDSLLAALGTHDVMTFNVDWQHGEPFLGWPVGSCGLRPLAAIRTSIAKRFTFPDWWQSEDRAFRIWLRTQTPTVLHLDKTLYGYNFKRAKPEYGGGMYPSGGRMASRDEVRRVVGAQA